MANFVLVHGLGLGGWCWDRVAARLREEGHQVFTPSLSGVAEHSHTNSADINLDTHITDVANLLHWYDLEDVILVGHSYGGSVVTGAADRCQERLKALVYLDAFILEDGQSVMSMQPPHRVEYYDKLVAEQGEGWKLYPNSAEFYGLSDVADQKWIDALSRPQSFATFTQPISLQQSGSPPYQRCYIWASGFDPSPFVQFAERVRNDSQWIYREVPGGHMLMTSHPNEVVATLMELAE